MSKSSLKEEHIVNYLIKNWDRYFSEEELFYHSKEYIVTPKWRVDLLCYINMPHPLDESIVFRAPVYTEVKYKNYRDLVYEIQKAQQYINRPTNDKRYPKYLALILHKDTDETTLKYVKDNSIPCYVYDFQDNDLSTLEIYSLYTE